MLKRLWTMLFPPPVPLDRREALAYLPLLRYLAGSAGVMEDVVEAEFGGALVREAQRLDLVKDGSMDFGTGCWLLTRRGQHTLAQD